MQWRRCKGDSDDSLCLCESELLARIAWAATTLLRNLKKIGPRFSMLKWKKIHRHVGNVFDSPSGKP